MGWKLVVAQITLLSTWISVTVCLNRAVLTVALYSHRHRYGTSDVPVDENRYVAAGMSHNHIPFFSTGDFDI